MVYFEAQNIVVFWIIIGVCQIAIAAIASMNFNYHMIWVTAMIGAYLILNFFSVFSARWPVDLNLPKMYEVGAVK